MLLKNANADEREKYLAGLLKKIPNQIHERKKLEVSFVNGLSIFIILAWHLMNVERVQFKLLKLKL